MGWRRFFACLFRFKAQLFYLILLVPSPCAAKTLAPERRQFGAKVKYAPAVCLCPFGAFAFHWPQLSQGGVANIDSRYGGGRGGLCAAICWQAALPL